MKAGDPPRPPTPVLDGFDVESCAWPTAVHLQNSDALCSGVYVGGNVVLTAAHCISTRFQVDMCCESDEDCPDADPFGNPVVLECTGGSEPICLSSSSPVTNVLPAIVFGERYDIETHPRRTIGVQYCRRKSVDEEPADDIGYCLLDEAPGVQPVPMMLECEAESFLKQGMPLVVVGFGRFVSVQNPLEDDFAGDKRYLEGTNMSDGQINPSEWTGAGPNAGLSDGDSGGPLFGQLPDGTWRVLAVTATAVSHTAVWSYFDWMLEDPNIAMQREKLWPCLGPEGEWAPTAACGGFPRTPNVPQGDWARGPFACYHDDLGGSSETCGAPFMPFSPLHTQSALPPGPPIRPPDDESIAQTPARGAAAFGALGALLLAGCGAGAGTVVRRRRNRHA